MQETDGLIGLSSEEVNQRVALGLTNTQEFEVSRTVGAILRANVFTLFNAVVGGAFLLLLILGQWQDALFGLAVLSNMLIGIVQEYRSKKILDKLAILNQTPVKVSRDGRSVLVSVQEVVQDDILELGRGDQLPADAKLLRGQGLELDESLLTGEAQPVLKIIGEELLAGSGVTGGSGLAQVIRVGPSTYSSKLVGEARKFTLVSSELRQALNRLILWISWALAPIIAIAIYGQLQATENWVDAVVGAVASVISVVPQGLVLITSIAFGIAAVKLARHRVLLQELAAVEGLARVDVVCFDKTGTLTDGEMQFDEALEFDSALSQGSAWKGVLGAFAHQENLTETTLALQAHFENTGLEVSQGTEFNSERKFSSLEVQGQTWSLGAPEVLTDDPEALAAASDLAALGRRALLVTLGQEKRTPIVLISFRENVRPETKAALEYFKSQGVSVRVLSGDHPQTVASVAKEAGLDAVGFDARNLPEDKAALAEILENNLVLGRVAPEQKKSIVAALQLKGHTVAMIGDGVNDAPALRQSDLGIAMGRGSAVTKAAANLVLMDNRLEILPSVVAEGRRVIANVERLSSLFLTKTVWAIILAVSFGVLLWEYPVLPRQLSALDGFSIGIPAFLLALLPNSQIYRPGLLRRALLFCVPAGTVTALAVLTLAIIVRTDESWALAQIQTATAMLLSVTGLWVLGLLVQPLTKIKLGILLAMVFSGIAVFLIPFTANFFQFVVLTQQQLLLTAGISLFACLGIWLSRYLTAKVTAK